MTDYFVANDANGAATGMDTAANGTAQPAANGGDDLGMDEILVGDLGFLAMDMFANSWASERRNGCSRERESKLDCSKGSGMRLSYQIQRSIFLFIRACLIGRPSFPYLLRLDGL